METLNPGKIFGTCNHFAPPRRDSARGSRMAPGLGGDPPDPEYPDSPDAETCVPSFDDEGETP